MNILSFLSSARKKKQSLILKYDAMCRYVVDALDQGKEISFHQVDW